MIDRNKLDHVYADIHDDPAFAHLRLLGNRLVEGEGDNPRVFIVGEAPGAQEAMARRPFIGPAGQVLRDLMDLAELWSTDSHCDPSRPANCWLTNVVKYRPDKNRTPTRLEVVAARPYLVREWQAVGKPPVIVCVGATALMAITGRARALGTVVGNHTRIGDVHVWAMWHPAYGLRNESVRPDMEQHWKRLGEWLKANE